MANAFARIALLLLACSFPHGATQAQEIGMGLVCDKAEQAEIYLAHVDASDNQTALTEVNRDDKTACAIAPVAYSAELDIRTLVFTRGLSFPLSALPSRLKCPACGSRQVRLIYTAPGQGNAARAANRIW